MLTLGVAAALYVSDLRAADIMVRERSALGEVRVSPKGPDVSPKDEAGFVG